MFKRYAAAFMAVLMAAVLAGCAQTPEVPQGTTQSTQPAQPTQATQPPATQPSATIPETTVVDNENCTFRIVALEEDSLWGYALKVFLENKTDKDLMFSLRDVSVNGYMCDPLFAAAVSAGMKANEVISFLQEDLTSNDITEVTDLAFTLAVYDSNNWSAEPLVDEDFSFFPMGKEAVRDYPRTAGPEDRVLFDNEDCTMIITGFEPDSLWGYSMGVYLENKTDDTLMFSVGDAAINGFMCDPYWAVTVAGGKKCNTEISWLNSALEENAINQVQTITLPVRVYESDDWTGDDLLNQTFEITP